jgi:predicted RNase H-like HicB family nuclease
MKAHDNYLMFVLWSEEDRLYVGYCPDLFPAGGVCHGATQIEAYGKLCDIVEATVKTAEEQGIPLPPRQTRPMREIEAFV